MRKKLVYKLALIIILLCIIPKFSYANEISQEYNLYIPPTLKNLQGKKEYTEKLKEIKNIRSNLSVMNVNALTAKENYDKLQKDIVFYISELDSVDRELNSIKKQYSSSKPDQVFGTQLQFTVQSIKLSLDEILILLDSIKANEPQGSDLFYSDYLVHIYFYLTLADQMIAYVDNYYNLS